MPHPAFTKIDHRPWPLPTRPWAWRQSWCDLLFAHWPVPLSVLQPLVPAPLTVQTFEGTAWVGIVPFHMTGVMRRGLPDIPGISAFPELNVRLYVEHEGKPGVWFLSLDATQRLAIWAARRFFHLPYQHAAMRITKQDETFDYISTRKEKGDDASLHIAYAPTSAPYLAQPDTLEYFLTERYCLYAQDPKGRLYCGEVHHKPWPLQQATAQVHENTMLNPHGITLSGPPTLLHFAKRIDVVVWNLQRCIH